MNPTPDSPFAGLRVAAFESRMAEAMSELIRRHGGEPCVAPSLREIPLEDNHQALAFADELLAGAVDVTVFLTGVGARALAQILETRVPRAQWIEALNRTEIVARGPKPAAALRELGARVDLRVPEPNTWNELLAALDQRRDLKGVRVALQEYGKPNPDLVAGLRQRGAKVVSVPVYRWALPLDTAPLRQTARDLTSGQISIALFTSAQQLVHLLEVAADEGIEGPLREALTHRVVIGSIGPTTSEALMAQGLAADIEPEHPRMGHLVAAVAAGWAAVVKARQAALYFQSDQPPATAPATAHPAASSGDDLRLHNSRFLKACRREPTDTTPIWLMRQAGRYMREYRDLRSRFGFLDLCKRPELAAEVTVTAAERLGVDAAILFADILLILEPMGLELEFTRGEGPVIHNPVRAAADVDRLREPDEHPRPLGFVLEAIRLIRRALPADVPLIGFAGAPFTLACYTIEGGGSRHYDKAKEFLYRDPGAWDALMRRLTDATAAYLTAQAEAGAQALQVFDSWVGNLGPDDYAQFVQPHMARLFAALPADVPVIHFGTGTGGLLELQREAGGSVIGVDWRVRLGDAWTRLGPEVAIQGNLDPVVLLAPLAEIQRQASRVLDEAGGRPGHIFNLGHGILPATPVDNVRRLVDHVHDHGAPSRRG